MKIQELKIRNFGKFTNSEVTFSDGINIVYGDNESGKSTLHTFIKAMLFGMERGRGRASATDTYSLYEPWENANYYSGVLRFECGGKHFCIDRNFDKYSKKAELLCEDDGEELSVQDGDLEMILNGLKASSYDDTVSVGQLHVQPGQTLAGELKNYATNYYAAGTSEINLEEALTVLTNKKKLLEKDTRQELEQTQQKRERLELEASYVWREIHKRLEEQENIRTQITFREMKERKNDYSNKDSKGVIDEIRPGKWRIHPIEIIIFITSIVLAFISISKPWNYLVAIILFLVCGIYVWNRMKVSKRPIKTDSEIILEEITPEEEKLPSDRLEWERARIEEELKEKQTEYSNLQERLEELDEVSDSFRENDKRRQAVQLAIEKLALLSSESETGLEQELNAKASEIIRYITNGKYTRLLVEDNLRMSLLSENKKIPIEKVSRGTIDQTYFALRMAVSDLLHEEEYPVILDDAFVFYDESRLKATLDWLEKNRRQVIVFTCQRREETLLNELGVRWNPVFV